MEKVATPQLGWLVTKGEQKEGIRYELVAPGSFAQDTPCFAVKMTMLSGFLQQHRYS